MRRSSVVFCIESKSQTAQTTRVSDAQNHCMDYTRSANTLRSKTVVFDNNDNDVDDDDVDDDDVDDV